MGNKKIYDPKSTPIAVNGFIIFVRLEKGSAVGLQTWSSTSSTVILDNVSSPTAEPIFRHTMLNPFVAMGVVNEHLLSCICSYRLNTIFAVESRNVLKRYSD